MSCCILILHICMMSATINIHIPFFVRTQELQGVMKSGEKSQ